MSKREILAGATNQTIDVFIADSSSTTGAGLASLVYNSASLTCYYRKGATGTSTQLTLATQTVGGAHSDGGFVEVDAANMKGVYRLDLSDTMVASAGMLTVVLSGATNMAPCVLEIEVVSVNKFDSVRMGMTALPNAAADAAGGLPISDAGGLDLDAIKTKTDFLPSATAGAAGGLFIAGTNAATTITSSSGSALTLSSTGGNGHGLSASGNGSGSGILANAGATGNGLYVLGGATSGHGLYAVGGTTSGHGFFGVGGGSSNGMRLTGDSAADGLYAIGGATGDGIEAVGQGGGVDIRGDITGNVTGNLSGSVGSLTGHTVQTGDTYALANGSAGFVAIDTVVDSILAAIGTPIDFGSGTSTIAANLQDMADNGTATYDRSTDSLQAIRDHVGDGTNLTEAGGDGDHLSAIPKTGFKLASDGLDLVTAWTVDITGTISTVTTCTDLTSTAHAEPTGVPAANETIADKIGYLFMALRNRIDVTASKKTFYGDDGVAEWEKDLSDDTTTYSESEGNAI